MTHTPTPWAAEWTIREHPSEVKLGWHIFSTADDIANVDGVICELPDSNWLNGDQEATAAFIVRAVNAHDDLVAALEEVGVLVESLHTATATNAKGRDDNRAYKAKILGIIRATLAKAQ